MMTYETAAKQIRQAARTAAYHKGAAFTYADVVAMCVPGLSPRFICEQAELAGFPCWTSAPDEAWDDDMSEEERHERNRAAWAADMAALEAGTYRRADDDN